MNSNIRLIVEYYICDKINDHNICKYGLVHKMNHISNKDDCLSYACSYGNKKMVKLLIAQDTDNFSQAFYFACVEGHLGIVRLIVKKIKECWKNILHKNIVDRKFYNVKIIVDAGDVNWNLGLTLACRSDNQELIKYMVYNGADKCDNCEGTKCLVKYD